MPILQCVMVKCVPECMLSCVASFDLLGWKLCGVDLLGWECVCGVYYFAVYLIYFAIQLFKKISRVYCVLYIGLCIYNLHFTMSRINILYIPVFS